MSAYYKASQGLTVVNMAAACPTGECRATCGFVKRCANLRFVFPNLFLINRRRPLHGGLDLLAHSSTCDAPDGRKIQHPRDAHGHQRAEAG